MASMVLQNYQNFIEITSNIIYIVAFDGGLNCPRKIYLNTQCPSLKKYFKVIYEYPYLNKIKGKVADHFTVQCSVHAFHTTLVVKQKGTIEVKIVLILDSPMANLLFRSSHKIRLYHEQEQYSPARLHPNITQIFWLIWQ